MVNSHYIFKDIFVATSIRNNISAVKLTAKKTRISKFLIVKIYIKKLSKDYPLITSTFLSATTGFTASITS
jgi:hypothetical protein